MNEKKILALWQYPEHNKTLVNFYKIVNDFLLVGKSKVKINAEILRAFKCSNKTQFIAFIEKYINNLTKLLYDTKFVVGTILYRGEFRKKFQYNVDDIITYNTFHSTTSCINFAYGFSQNFREKGIRLLFIIYYPTDSHYKKLNEMITYNNEEKITGYQDEHEYLIPPNSYYQIIKKEKILDDVIVIKMKLILQEKIIIGNNKNYGNHENKSIDKEKIKIFDDKNLTKIIKQFAKYNNEINKMEKYESFSVKNNIYELLFDSNKDEILSVDVDKILNLIKDKNKIPKSIMDKIKDLGIGYYDYEIKNQDEYIEKIKNLKKLKNVKFKCLRHGKLFAGFFNVDNLLNEEKFIKQIKKNKIGKWNGIINTRLEPDYYIGDHLYRSDASFTLEKNDKKVTQYCKYIFEMNIKNVKICIAKNIKHLYQTFVLMIPNFKYEIIDINPINNKFGQKCYWIKCNISSE